MFGTVLQKQQNIGRDKEKKRQLKESESNIQEEANKQAASMKEKRKEDRSEGRQYAEEVLSRDVQGLTPEQRKNMESSGQRRLNRDIQGYQRQLTAQQGKSGIRGGAAYAQNADLARIGQEAQGQFQRDLSNLDSDLALKKLAAMFNIEQGEAAQGQTERQMAIDTLQLENERKRQRYLEDKFNRAFTKV